MKERKFKNISECSNKKECSDFLVDLKIFITISMLLIKINRMLQNNIKKLKVR